MSIILYDIANSFNGTLTLSPNVWKTRLSLNYKGLPYKTEWVVGIEPTLKKLGVPPTAKKEDGSPKYTLPAIYDPKTNKYIADSWEIAKYLDETYPDTPKLFPSGTTAAIALLQQQISQGFVDTMIPILQKPFFEKMSPASQDLVRKRREASSGKKLEELFPSPTEREAILEKTKASLASLADILDKNESTKPFFFGDEYPLTYGDIILISFLLAPKIVLPAEEWELIASWNGGRWEKTIEAAKIYQTMN